MTKAQPPQPLRLPLILYDTRNWAGGDTLENEGSAGSAFDLVVVRSADNTLLRFFFGDPAGVVVPLMRDVGAPWDGWAFVASLSDTDGTTLDWDDLGGPPTGEPFTLMVWLAQHEWFTLSGKRNPLDAGAGSFNINHQFELRLGDESPGVEPVLFIGTNRNVGVVGGVSRWRYSPRAGYKPGSGSAHDFLSTRLASEPAASSNAAHYDNPLLADPGGLSSVSIDPAYGGATLWTGQQGWQIVGSGNPPRPLFNVGADIDADMDQPFGSITIDRLAVFVPYAIGVVCMNETVVANTAGALAFEYPAAGFTAEADDYAIIALSGLSTDTTVPATPSGWSLLGSSFATGGTFNVALAVYAKRLTASEALPSVSVPASWVSSAGADETHRYAIGTGLVLRGVDDTTALDISVGSETNTGTVNFVQDMPTSTTDRAHTVAIVANDSLAWSGANLTGEDPPFWRHAIFMQTTSLPVSELSVIHAVAWELGEADTASPADLVWEGFDTDDHWASVVITLRPAVTTFPEVGEPWYTVGAALFRGEPKPDDLTFWAAYFG